MLMMLIHPQQTYQEPPWQFSDARVLYQPTLVPVKAAREVIPTNNNNSGSKNNCLSLLSLFGWTLGGIFVVDWAKSPIGPYREVAVLSGLVSQGFSIGAWASHIIVTTSDAVESGRNLYGLPTTLGSIEFISDKSCDSSSDLTSSKGQCDPKVTSANKNENSLLLNLAADLAVSIKYAFGTAVPALSEPAERLNGRTTIIRGGNSKNEHRQSGFFFQSENVVQIFGWDDWSSIENNTKKEDGESMLVGETSNNAIINLPSFSGLLPKPSSAPGDSSNRTPLLRYPLSFVRGKSIKLRPPMQTRCFSDDRKESSSTNHHEYYDEVSEVATKTTPRIDSKLRAVLDGCPRAIPWCIQLDGVDVIAGKPIEIL